MSTNTTATTTEASAEDRRHVQGIRDDDGGGSGSMTGPVDWQQQQIVDFPFYWLSNGNTASSLSIFCLVLIFFVRFLFFVRCNKYYQYYNRVENIFVPSIN